MATVVNDPNKILPRIFVINLKDIPSLSIDFLSNIAKPGYKTGVERKNYFVLNVNAIYRFAYRTKETEFFMGMMNALYTRQFQMVMLRK